MIYTRPWEFVAGWIFSIAWPLLALVCALFAIANFAIGNAMGFFQVALFIWCAFNFVKMLRELRTNYRLRREAGK